MTNKSPLNAIHTQLETDMEAVNTAILERLESGVPLIPQIAKHLIESGGKRIRPLLTLASTALNNGDMTRAHKLAASVEFIHSATLLHDDVVDESGERRGKTTANLIYGNQEAVLVGDFLFARAFQLMTEDGSLDVLRILSGASAIISEGEVMQLAHKGSLTMTMDDYIAIITAKTAALFAAATEVGPAIAGTDKMAMQAMYDYGLNLGIAFQIADDTLDYMADSAALGKEIGDDFREGKLTAPILFALQDANDDERVFWQRTLNKCDQKDGDFETALDILGKHNTIERSMKLAKSYGQKAKDALKNAPEHPLKPELIALIDYSIHRNT